MKNVKKKTVSKTMAKQTTDKLRVPWKYNRLVLEHFRNPKNFLWDEKGYKADAKGVSDPSYCGDYVMIWLKINPKTRRIKDCKWRAFGCASAIASTSALSVALTEKGGMTVERALKLKSEDMIKKLKGMPYQKTHCVDLGLSALRNAIGDR